MAQTVKFWLSLALILMSLLYNVYITIKTVIAKKRAGKLTDEDKKNAWLKVKEIARTAMYEAEEKFKAMSTTGIKCGAFKLDSVLKTVDIECLKLGLDYDPVEVKTFVDEEIKRMKGVK